MYQISANLVHRELRNATFEEKKCQPQLKSRTLGITHLYCSWYTPVQRYLKTVHLEVLPGSSWEAPSFDDECGANALA